MLARLFLLFTIVPLVELYLLIKIGSAIGALNTILIVVATALLGAYLARLEGLRTLRQINHDLSQGVLPAEALVDGLLIFTGGVLLITPGVATDFLALLFLIPFTRTYIKRWLRKKFDRMIASGNVRFHIHGGSFSDS
jgi:UPF0716 protein FxsA